MKVARFKKDLYSMPTIIETLSKGGDTYWIESSKADDPRAEKRMFADREGNDTDICMAKTTLEYITEVIKLCYEQANDGEWIAIARTYEKQDGFFGMIEPDNKYDSITFKVIY